MSYPKLSWWQLVSGDYFCPDGVDMIDLGFWAEHWLDSNCEQDSECGRVDVKRDDVIDFADFAIFANNWLAGI